MNIYAGFAPKEREREGGGRERRREGGRVVEVGGNHTEVTMSEVNWTTGNVLVTTWATSTHVHVHFLSRACTHTTLHPHYHTASPLSLTTQHSSCTPLSPSHNVSRPLIHTRLLPCCYYDLHTVHSAEPPNLDLFRLMWRVLSWAWMPVGNTLMWCHVTHNTAHNCRDSIEWCHVMSCDTIQLTTVGTV